MSAAQSSWLPLGELLVERQLLSRRQLDLALVEHHRTGRPLGEVLVGFGFVSEQALASTLLEQVGLMGPKDEAPAEARPQPEPAPEPEPEPRRAGHLAEAEPERPVVFRVEEMAGRRGSGGERVQALEDQVAEFERRSEEIQESILQIRSVLAELRAS